MKKLITLIFFALLRMYSAAQDCDPIDQGFGTNGSAIGFTMGPNSWLNSLPIITQPDGKIIQAGNIQNYNGYTSSLAVLRYNENGDLDGGFGSGGRVLFSFGYYAYISDVALQADGKIVVAGFAHIQNQPEYILLRFKNNGNLDSSFGINGYLIPSISVRWENNSRLTVQPDGKIVVAGIGSGSANLCQIQSYPFAQGMVLRLKADGSPDSSFGQNGKIIIANGNYADAVTDLAVQPDGKILVAGSSSYDCSCMVDYYGGLYWACQKFYSLVQRFNADGSSDSAFGKNGKITDSLVLNAPSQILLQSNGKIVVTSGAQNVFVVDRYNSDGSPDNSFGTAGKVTTTIGLPGNYASLSTTTILPDGKIMQAGSISDNTATNFLIVRYNSDGSLDSHFGTGGIAIFHVGLPSSSDAGTGLDLQGTKIILGGSIYEAQSINMVLVRLQDPLISQLGSIITADGPVRFCEGGNVKLSSGVSGALQWYNNGAPVPGASGSSHVATVSGSYSLLVNNAGVCSISDIVQVTVVNKPLPEITTNDELAFCEGEQAILSASGTGNMQWFRNGNPVNGAVTNSYTAVSSGSYTVVATDSLGCVGSSFPIVVTAKSSATPIISWTGPTSFCEGGNVTLSTTTTDFPQWYRDGGLIGDATGSTYTATIAGSYSESNGCGVAIPVVITMNAKPPKPLIDWDGNELSTNTGYASYQWLLNGAPIAGATSNSYAPDSTDGSFTVQVTNDFNCINVSDVFTKVVTAVADITVGDSKLRYYPNPTKAVLYVDIALSANKNLVAEIYDLTGRRLYMQQLKPGHNEISLNGLMSGLYGLVINNGKEKAVRKLMVIK